MTNEEIIKSWMQAREGTYPQGETLAERRCRGARAWSEWKTECLKAKLKGLPEPLEPIESIIYYPEHLRPIFKF